MWIQDYIDRKFTVDKSAYSDWNKKYEVKDMLDYIKSEKLKPENIDVNSMKHETRRYSLNTIDFVEHMVRVNNSDLKYPIIIHYDWQVVDWYHRIAKAILQKKKTIKAYRIDVTKIKYSIVE